MDEKTARPRRLAPSRVREHPANERPVMRHLPIARPGAALLAACLMTTTPFASSQVPAAPSATPNVPSGPVAVAPESTPEALSAELVGKTFFLRGFYQDDKLDFGIDGKV